MDAMEWIIGNDTGISSKNIWTVATGLPLYDMPYYYRGMTPADPSDFGRCYRLLKCFKNPDEVMAKVAERFPNWKPLVREWKTLTQMYETAVSSPEGRAPEMYNLMQKLNEEGRKLEVKNPMTGCIR
jgi:hypothetical protein